MVLLHIDRPEGPEYSRNPTTLGPLFSIPSTENGTFDIIFRKVSTASLTNPRRTQEK